MTKTEFNKKMDKVIDDMTKKHSLTKHRLLNYGGMIGAEFQERIKALKQDDNFSILFDEYIAERSDT